MIKKAQSTKSRYWPIIAILNSPLRGWFRSAGAQARAVSTILSLWEPTSPRARSKKMSPCAALPKLTASSETSHSLPMSAEPTRKAKQAAAFRSAWYMVTLFILNPVNGIPLHAHVYGICRSCSHCSVNKLRESVNYRGKSDRCVVPKILLRPLVWFRL